MEEYWSPRSTFGGFLEVSWRPTLLGILQGLSKSPPLDSNKPPRVLRSETKWSNSIISGCHHCMPPSLPCCHPCSQLPRLPCPYLVLPVHCNTINLLFQDPLPNPVPLLPPPQAAAPATMLRAAMLSPTPHLSLAFEHAAQPCSPCLLYTTLLHSISL